jgi:hypothetical protein
MCVIRHVKRIGHNSPPPPPPVKLTPLQIALTAAVLIALGCGGGITALLKNAGQSDVSLDLEPRVAETGHATVSGRTNLPPGTLLLEAFEQCQTGPTGVAPRKISPAIAATSASAAPPSFWAGDPDRALVSRSCALCLFCDAMPSAWRG